MNATPNGNPKKDRGLAAAWLAGARCLRRAAKLERKAAVYYRRWAESQVAIGESEIHDGGETYNLVLGPEHEGFSL